MVVTVFMQLIQIAILSRFLTPEDFGLIGLYSLAYGVLGIFVGFGIVKALIHKPIITREELNSVFWFNLLRASFFGILLYLIGIPVGAFYNSPELQSVLIYGSFTYLFIAIGQVHNALLQKELRFFHYAICEILSNIANVIVSIFLAAQGKGAESYMIGSVVHQGIRSGLSFLFTFSSFVPTFTFSFKSIFFFLRFGIYQAGNDIFNFFTIRLDEIFIGKWFPIGTYGIYTMGKRLPFRLSQVVNPVITTTLLPLFSKMQNFSYYLQQGYLTTLSNLLSFTLPVYGFMLLFSKEIVYVFFGSEWEAVIPILRLVVIWSAAKDFLYLTGLMIYVKGRTDFSFWWSLFSLILFSIVFGIFVHTNLFTLLWIVIITQILLIPINWRFVLYPLIRIPFIPVLTHILHPSLLVFVSMLITFILKWGLINYFSINYLLTSIVMISTYVFLLFAFYYFFNKKFIAMFFKLVGFSKPFVPKEFHNTF